MDLRRYGILGWAAYGVALLLILFPVVDSLLGVWPLNPGQVTWRFGALGLFSRAIMTPTLGILVALAAAVVLEHRWALRLVSVAAFLAAGLALAALGVFVLDASQTRSQVVADAQGAFTAASVVAILKYGLGAALLLLLAAGGWRASRETGRARGRVGEESSAGERGRAEGLIVGSSRS
jgi:hypothetical protein